MERLRAEVEQQKAPAVADVRSVPPSEPREDRSRGQAFPAVTAANVASSSVMAISSSPAGSANTSDAPAKKPKIDPFSDWDWTWLNGNPRNKDTAFDSKFFTPEIRADVTYAYDFNKPKDNTISGSSEIFRSNEVQLEQLGLGGDFHYDNVRARFMTQFGMYSATTPRNDPSPRRGNGMSILPTAIWQKPTAVTTSMR